MLTVFKYEVPIGDVVSLALPHGAEILSLQLQHGVPCLWALVDPDQVNRAAYVRRFRMAGTGHPITERREQLWFIGTVHLYGGDLVFHLFEIVDPWCVNDAQEETAGANQ